MNALIEQCRRLGVQLRVEGGALAYDAPKGVMTPALAAELKAHKPAILAALTLPPLSPASEVRRQKVLAMLARDGGRYAVYVEDPNTDPVVMALATPDGTCDVLIPKDRYDPFAVLEVVKEWEREDLEAPPPLLWRVSITEPGGRPVNLDEALRAACEDVGGITPEVFRSLLSPEDLDDIEAGDIHPKTLKGFAGSFAEGIRSGRVVVLP
jgi:TubC N-terminal docking domain